MLFVKKKPIVTALRLLLIANSCCFDALSRCEPHTVKSCIKAAAYVQVFNFLVRLLFKCGFYLRAAYMQSPKSAKPVKAVSHMWNESETWHFDVPNYVECKQTFGMRKAVRFGPTSTTTGLLFGRGLCATWVWRKRGFFSSAASNQVRLLYTTLQY